MHGSDADLNPARPEAVVGYTSHKLLVAQLGTMVTPRPSPTATQRMNLLRRVSGSIEMTCIQHDTLSTLIAMPHWESSSWDYCEMYQQQQLTMEQKGGRLNGQRPNTYARFAIDAHVTAVFLCADWMQQVERW